MKMIFEYIGKIQCVISGTGMDVKSDPPTFKVGNKTRKVSTIWYAGTIVHDANHSKQYHDFLLKNPNREVPAKEYTGKEAEAECLGIQAEALEKMNASKEVIDWVKASINTNYWTKTNRNW